MFGTGDQINDWARVVAELNAYRETQRETWGDIDDLLVAKYLTGNCSDQERTSVEAAMESHPAVRELIGVVRDVLGVSASEAQSSAAELIPSKSVTIWRAAKEAMTLVDHLVAWVDRQGRLLSAGLQSCLFEMQPAYGQAMGPTDMASQNVQTIRWEIPISSPPGRLTISVRASEPSGDWDLCCQLQCPFDPDLPSRVRVEIRDTHGDLEYGGRFTELAGEPISLKPGVWQMSLFADDRQWRIPLELRESSVDEP